MEVVNVINHSLKNMLTSELLNIHTWLLTLFYYYDREMIPKPCILQLIYHVICQILREERNLIMQA